MTTSCHLTKAPEMKYIDERYQSRPTLPSYHFGGGGGDQFACGHQIICFNYKISITTSCALTSSVTITSWEKISNAVYSLQFTAALMSSRWTDGNMGILYHYSPKNVVSLDRITCKRIDKIKNYYVVNNLSWGYSSYFAGMSILLGILNTIYQEIPASVCSHCEGHAEIVKFLNIVWTCSLSLPLYLGPRGEAVWWWRCLGSVWLIALFGWGFPYHNWEETPFGSGDQQSAFVEQNQLFLSHKCSLILPLIAA